MKALYWKRDRGEKFQTITAGNAAVKIYRRTRGKGKARRFVFEVCDYTRGPGLRRLRGFGDYRAAHAEAARIAGQLATGKATAAAMLGTETASFGRAVELLRPTGVSLEAAAADYARAFELVGDAVVEACKFYSTRRPDMLLRRTVAEVAVELLANKDARGMSPRYLGDLKQKVTRFAEAFACDIGSITTGDVQGFLDKLKGAPQTLKNYRTVLYTLFSFAEARGYVFKGGNVVEDTEKVDTNGGGAIEIYSPAEMLTLLQAAPKPFLPFLLFGGFAGLRTAEIERLDWRAVDLAGGFITVGAVTAKTRSRRPVPIVPNLTHWLTPYAKQRGLVWKGDETDSREARAATAEKAGVAWKHNALRHSFCSYRLAQIQSAAQVALEAGNSPDVIFKHYRELVRPEAARTWFSISPEAPANVVTLKTEVATV